MQDTNPISKDELLAIPGDALLAEVLLVQDRSGAQPPKILVAEVRAESPKQGNYYLNAKLLKIDTQSLLALLKGEVCEWKTYQCSVISPIDLVRLRVVEDGDTPFKGKAAIELREMCPNGIDVFSGLCLADQKEVLVEKVLGVALQKSEIELARLQACVDGIQALRAGLGLEQSPGLVVATDEKVSEMVRADDGASPR